MVGDDFRGISYSDEGEGMAIIMLPGMEGSKEFWRPQQEALRESHRVVACDLPLFRPRLSRNISDYACAVIDVMDSLEVERAVVVGESLGGTVAQELAIVHPERVCGLVLVNTIDHRNRFGFGLNMFTLATIVHQFALLPFLTDRARRRLLGWVGRHRGFVMDPTPGNERLIDYLFEYGTQCGPGGYLDRMIAGSTVSFTDRLAGIGVPTLVIRGTEDRLVRPEAVLSFVGRIPSAELALIEGGGHCCSHTMPDETNAAVVAWLENVGL